MMIAKLLPRLGALGVAAGLAALAAAAGEKMTTYTYKQVGSLAIKADVYEPDGFAGPRPVLVWIHGGALMSGSRELEPDHRLKRSMLADGAVVVSIDYRLAPETKLPAIITDVEDAFRWIREQGPGLFRADPERIVVAGSSAGGYLTLVAGYRIHPRPRALVSYWGYGDLIGAWYSEPSRWPRHQKLFLTRETAYSLVSGPPVANKADRPGEGGANFYMYCRQQGIWPREATGWDPKREPEKFYPYMPLRNVTPDYPPTLLIHGLKDTDVPAENSRLMAAEFRRQGVEHRLITDPEADHGSFWSPEARAAIDAAALEFFRAHLAPR
ncbi:MAG: alpha/beta hydrolase [Opitutaceae bacterium]|nr:alpha/beta hydrolase [Opitutaceae bacterium]